MYRLLVEKQRRQLPYYLCTVFALGLSHEKTIWEKQRSREWWTDIVRRPRTSDGGNGNHSLSLPIILIKIKVDQMLPSSYISSLLVSIL